MAATTTTNQRFGTSDRSLAVANAMNPTTASPDAAIADTAGPVREDFVESR